MKPIRYGGIVAGQEEIDAAVAVLQGQGWGQGPVVEEFERHAALSQGRKHALFVNSGSSALLLAIHSLKLPLGSQIAMPALQFPTLYSAAIHAGMEPVLVDVDTSLNLDLHGLWQLPGSVKAVAFVHLAGNPTGIDRVWNFCQTRGIPLLEDNCEGLGGRIFDRPVGSFGEVSCTSTHAAHTICTGEGGFVFTDIDEIDHTARLLRDWGRSPEMSAATGYHYTYEIFGYNLHATDIQAAIGIAQLARLDTFAERRRENYQLLRAGLEELPIVLPVVAHWARPSWFCFPMLCDHRDKLMAHLAEHDIETRPILAGNMGRQPLPTMEHPEKYPQADQVYRHGLWVSVHPSLTEDDINRIIDVTRGFYA